jgi:hypothetical protein
VIIREADPAQTGLATSWQAPEARPIVLVWLLKPRLHWTIRAQRRQRGATHMGLLIAYIATLLVGQSISVGIGLLIDRYHSSYGGLMVFIALYFFMFWAAWRIAVKLTEPKSTA